MQAIVGKNDVGKSSLLYALDLFLNERPPKPEEWSHGCDENETIDITTSFTDFEDPVEAKLTKMCLVSPTARLVIRKTFSKGKRQAEVSLLTWDYADEDFRNLYSKKEQVLNRLGAKHNLGFVKSGRSITNESKREELAEHARQKGVPKTESWIIPDEEALEFTKGIMPELTLFRSGIELRTDQSEVQNPFQLLVQNVAEADVQIQDVQRKIEKTVSEEVSKIEKNLREQTATITKLTPKASFHWNKIIQLEFETEDEFGTKIGLEYRGMGIQRLVMVAFFKYLAEKNLRASDSNGQGQARHVILAIEEPETYLHPSAQRELIDSFKSLRKRGYQILLTSHSPVFAAEADPEGLALVIREDKLSKVIQQPILKPETVIDELGILPRDQLFGYSACVFVEGKADQFFLETVAEKLKAARKIPATFKDRNIGIVIVGGDNLRFYVEGQLVKKLNRHFGVVKDSDKKMSGATLARDILEWKRACETMGGLFLILDKRQIENYLHPAAIKRATGKSVIVEDYNDVKKLISTDYSWERHMKPIVEQMTAEEILESDKYQDGANERHELLEKLNSLLQLAD